MSQGSTVWAYDYSGCRRDQLLGPMIIRGASGISGQGLQLFAAPQGSTIRAYDYSGCRRDQWSGPMVICGAAGISG